MRRGEYITTPGGGRGRFVGVSPSGVVWVAYHERAYQPMCLEFDLLLVSLRERNVW